MPRLLYHLHALPVQILNYFLRAVNHALVMFLWAHKPPRLAQFILQLPKLLGGMALSDITSIILRTICHKFWSGVVLVLKQWVGVEQILAGGLTGYWTILQLVRCGGSPRKHSKTFPSCPLPGRSPLSSRTLLLTLDLTTQDFMG